MLGHLSGVDVAGSGVVLDVVVSIGSSPAGPAGRRRCVVQEGALVAVAEGGDDGQTWLWRGAAERRRKPRDRPAIGEESAGDKLGSTACSL
jgi:hypothetical protein